LIAAQRATGEALAGTLNEQLKPSALLPGLSAAKAALVALMQNSNSAAATISIVNLMTRSSQNHRNIVTCGISNVSQKQVARRDRKIGPVLA